LVVGGITVLLLSALAFRRHARGAPAILAGWGAMLALMLPLVLLVPGQQPLADRYSYLAGMPLAVLAGAGVATLLSRVRVKQRVSVALFLALPLAVLAVLAFRQTALWTSPESLWRHAATTSPGVPLAHYQLGLALTGAGKGAEALAAFQQATTLAPTYVDAHVGAAQQFYEQGNLERAHSHATSALRLDTTSAPAWNIRGMALYRGGRKEEARKSFWAAQLVRPADPLAYVNMALIDLTDRNAAGAAELLKGALERGADSIVVIPYLATAMVLDRDEPAARILLSRLAVRSPEGPSADTRLADIHLRLRDTTAALRVLGGAVARGDTGATALLRRIRPASPSSGR
jgi:Flp pilus assembly protein TadD